MKVLFLDIDGVLNSATFLGNGSRRNYRRARGAGKAAMHADHERMVDMLDPAAVARINAVLAATAALVVLSSSWRIAWPVPAIVDALCAAGFTGMVIDRTPNGAPIPPEWVDRPHSEWSRGIEIQAWLDGHPEVTAFAIVDDSADMAHLMPRLVRTTWAKGIEQEHVERLVALLNGTTPTQEAP